MALTMVSTVRLLHTSRTNLKKGDRFVGYRRTGKPRHVVVVKVHNRKMDMIPTADLREVSSKGSSLHGRTPLGFERASVFTATMTFDHQAGVWTLPPDHYRPLGATFTEEFTPVDIVQADLGKCDKCKGPRKGRNNAVALVRCPVDGCTTFYARCSQHGGDEGARRSLHSHGAVNHTGVKVV